jgi:hypothetical protein
VSAATTELVVERLSPIHDRKGFDCGVESLNVFLQTQARKGLGGRLLWDALKRSQQASREIGSVAVIVDAKDEDAARFHERYGFLRFIEPPLRLYLMMATIAAAGGTGVR